MGETFTEGSKDVVLGFSFIFMYVRNNSLLSNSAKLMELKQFYLDIVKGSSTDVEFLEAIENDISKYESEELAVPSYLIDLEAFVKVNIS